jgi:hypothetical protein
VAEAALAPAERQLLHRLRSAATAGRGRPEADDDKLLLQMAQLLRDTPGLSNDQAARAVVATLPHDTMLRSGDRQVEVGKARHVSLGAYEKHLQQKFPKHKGELFRRLDSQELGRNLAQRHVVPIAGLQRGELTIRLPIGRDFVAKVSAAAMERANNFLSNLSLSDATDAFLLEARRQMRRRRIG